MYAELINSGEPEWQSMEYGVCEGDGSSPTGNGQCVKYGSYPGY